MIPFNALKCPLSGINLIEASAGTGKTHALASLFLRFIIEEKLTPRQILVITYTKAATAEIKKRIHKMLQDAQKAFDKNQTDNSFLLEIINQYPAISTRKRIAGQLALALASFDEAAIHTIHGFCQRVLIENAFESGTIFDIEPIDNQQSLENEFVEDFWRRNFYCNDSAIVRYALSTGINKRHFSHLLKASLTKTNLQVIPDYEHLDLTEWRKDLEKADAIFRQFREIWNRQRGEIISSLQDKALSGLVYGKKSLAIAREIDRIIMLPDTPLPLPEALNKLSWNFLCAKTNKGKSTPQHPIFLVCQDLCSLIIQLVAKLDKYLTGLKKQFLQELIQEFPRIKMKKNVLYYDDLLAQANLALQNRGGKQLGEKLRGKYISVLVDEFQDTDPVQFAILQAIFAPVHYKVENAVFYIGDPKQAIYSFRGADIFAYLRAAVKVNKRYTMRENWRSEESLLKAINVLFATPDQAFVYDEIVYNRIESAPEAQTAKLLLGGDVNKACLQWWYLPAGDDDKPLGVAAAREIITKAVVAEISRLVKLGRQRMAFIGEQALQESDIAVLVRKNSEAITLQKELTAAGIPSVLFSSESVFLSAEAEEMERFLLGIIFWENEGYLAAALTTSFFQLPADELSALLKDENALERWRNKFQEYNALWQFKGFLTMFYIFLAQEHIRTRLMSFPGGKKQLTNFLHLAQELQVLESRDNLNFQDILKWLTQMRFAEDKAEETQQERLSTDENCVRIVTIHKSKGLEYPIVFCPFSWEDVKRKNDALPLFFHDEKNNWQLTADFGSPEMAANQKQYAKEILAEDCRLLYVALTRAKNRCYFVSGKIRNTETSAISYLFHRPDSKNTNRISPQSSEDMLAGLVALASSAPQDIQVTKLDYRQPVEKIPVMEKDESLQFHPFPGIIDQNWKIASFTYLTSLHQPSDEELEHGDDDLGYAPAGSVLLKSSEYENMLNFPRGNTSGILLHEIIERLHFAQADNEAAHSLIVEILEKYGYSQQWLEPIAGMLKALMNSQLGKQGESEFCLAQIQETSCRKEVEFYFPLKKIIPEKIINVLENHGLYGKYCINSNKYAAVRNYPQVGGFLKGFIDLIFEHQGKYYLADWKSNYLGDGYESYAPELILRKMSMSSYVVQYLIYIVALDQYLGKRIVNYNYEDHFGGVYYFFLRGLNKEKGPANGIYYDRPSQDIVKQFKQAILE